MQGPWLNTLQKVGVHGRLSSTLQGSCEKGIGLICRRLASARPTVPTSKRSTRMQRHMTARPKCYVDRTWRRERPRQALLVFTSSRSPAPLSPLLDVLDACKFDPLGTLPGVAEIELVPGEVHGIAIDVVGDAGGVGGYKCVELLAVLGRDPARELELAYLDFD